MAIKGLKEIVEKNAEAAEIANQNRVKFLFLNEGDAATIRFLDDDQVIETKLHEYKEMAPQGEKFRKAYCPQNLFGKPCKWCAAGNVPKSVYVFLVYVYNIIHKTQNPDLNTNPEAVKWDLFKQGNNITLYKENVGDIRIFRMKFGKDGVMKNTIHQFVSEYGTLSDRDYRYSRSGSGIKTVYSLVPRDPTQPSSEVAAAIERMPNIIEVVGGPKREEPSSESKIDSDIPSESQVNQDIEDIF